MHNEPPVLIWSDGNANAHDAGHNAVVANSLAGQPALDMLTPLSPETKFGAEVLFWTFLATAYFVLLNLLIAIFNSAYERVISNSISEWLFIRLGLLLEFEKDFEQPGVRAYYAQLEQRDGRRAGTAGSTITQE